MGVYIKGMEMPRNCAACCLDSFCKHWDIRSDRHEDCPLIPVPDHGRLIDADEVREIIDTYRPGRIYEDAWALTVMDNAPTIIPAEEGK